MEITLLGQSGLSIRLPDGESLIADPYLSDTLRETKGESFRRRVPIDPGWGGTPCSLLLVTHGHGDHWDEASVRPLLDRPGRLDVLAPADVCARIGHLWPRRHNAMAARAGVEFTGRGFSVRCVHAFHSVDAVGYVVQAEGKNIYISGDTLYSREIVRDMEGEKIDAAFLCINGFGNNMNAADAARLAKDIHASLAVPVHWDMFGPYGADPSSFAKLCPAARVFRAYETLNL